MANLPVTGQRFELEKAVRTSAHDLFGQIGEYFFKQKKAINEIIIVPLSIVARIIRTHDAIKLLLENEYLPESAVLALTQFELRLDLAYASLDVKNAAEWLGHTDMKWSVRKVSEKLESLFGKSAERTRLDALFQHLSGIKHGNPLYSELGFPGRTNGQTISLTTGDTDDEFAQRYKEVLFAYATYQLAWSTQVLNKFTARYAMVDKDLRLRVQSNFGLAKPTEIEFLEFLKTVTRGREGHFGLRKYAKKRN